MKRKACRRKLSLAYNNVLFHHVSGDGEKKHEKKMVQTGRLLAENRTTKEYETLDVHLFLSLRIVKTC